MTSTERKEALSRYLRAAGEIRRAVDSAPAEAMEFRPFEGAWTMREHVNHVLDAELNAFVRYRSAVAEPGATIMAYDSERWTAGLSYAIQDPRKSIAVLQSVLDIVATHLDAIALESWDQFVYEYPDYGSVTLEQWLINRCKHLLEHLDYIKRNRRLYDRGSGRREGNLRSPH